MRILVALLAVAGLPAQELKLYSEFQRIDPFGNVAAPDAGAGPREILSPLVARNGWASFHLACTVAPDVPSFLYIQQNPELFAVTLYKEIFVETPRGWIPDALEKVALPYTIILPDAVHPIPRQSTVVFWLDIRVPAQTPPGRMRFEADLKTAGRWLVYPMEVRVARASLKRESAGRGPLPPIQARSDAALLAAVCGPQKGNDGAGITIRRLIRRNALQDLSLAPQGLDRFCKIAPADAEWWLPIRRELYGK